MVFALTSHESHDDVMISFTFAPGITKAKVG